MKPRSYSKVRRMKDGTTLRLDLTGQKFWRLRVMYRIYDEPLKSGDAMWLCECDCGELHRASASNLRKGKVKSCGCGHRGRAKVYSDSPVTLGEEG